MAHSFNIPCLPPLSDILEVCQIKHHDSVYTGSLTQCHSAAHLRFIMPSPFASRQVVSETCRIIKADVGSKITLGNFQSILSALKLYSI
jgi:hypothetical protein